MSGSTGGDALETLFAIVAGLTICALTFAWTVILPVIGLLYVIGFIGE